MINKYPSYSSIVEWANKLKDYELDNVYFSVKGKPRIKLKSRRLFNKYYDRLANMTLDERRAYEMGWTPMGGW